MADDAEHGYNRTFPIMLYPTGSQGRGMIVRATLVSDVFSTKDYIHRIQLQFTTSSDYEPTKGDVVTGIDFARTGGSWDMMDAFTSQPMSSFVPLGLDEINNDKNIYTFIPLILISGKETSSMFEGGVYHTTTFGGVDILKFLLFGAENVWNSGSATWTGINPFQTQKNTPYPVVTVENNLNAKIPSKTVEVQESTTKDSNGNTQTEVTTATEYSFDPLDIYKETLQSQTGGLSVIYYCPMDGTHTAQLQFKNDASFWGASDWTEQKDGVLVSADALNISEVTKEDYRNNHDKFNVIQTYYNKIDETKDDKGNVTSKQASYGTYKMVAKTSQGYVTAPIDDHDHYEFHYPNGDLVLSAGPPVKDRVKIDTLDDQAAIFQASSKLSYLWDKPFSLYTIKANLSNSFMLTQTQEG